MDNEEKYEFFERFKKHYDKIPCEGTKKDLVVLYDFDGYKVFWVDGDDETTTKIEDLDTFDCALIELVICDTNFERKMICEDFYYLDDSIVIQAHPHETRPPEQVLADFRKVADKIFLELELKLKDTAKPERHKI